MFDPAFNAVISASVATGKWINTGLIGLDYFSGTGAGWTWYDFYGELFPSKPSSQVAHVTYALPRTLVIKTAKGKYAKLIIYSLYNDAPEIPDRTYKAGFLTMKFVVQIDGSTNLNIQ